jgi:hypothetical protein
MARWYERLAPVVERARAQIRGIKAERLIQRSGCVAVPGGLQLTLEWQAYTIGLPDLAIRRAGSGEEPSEFVQALILTYLATADGTPPSGRWIAYHDLPGGMFYAQAFRGYAENRLARELGEDGEAALRAAAARLDGKEIDIGSAGYVFQILPRVRIGAVYWLGDEDFPSRASILFEETASHYMSTDGLAVLGSHLVNAILERIDDSTHGSPGGG